MTFRRLKLLFASALFCACATPGRAASLFDPALRFRVLRTDHFVIHFHQGEERVAMRLAPIAEDVWHALAKPLGKTPPPLTRVILANQTELANGYATPLPRDTIVIFATWPGGVETLGQTDDFLRLAFTHEFTHIVHLDRSEGYARVIRAAFGRTLLSFPNEFLPQWQIEGLAVYEESALTGEGRQHAGDFRAIVGEAARQRTLEPLDRVNGGLTDWPGGAGAYAYGLGFHDYLVDRFGDDSFGRLADASARQLPYAGSRAFKQVYGLSLGDLWRDYEAAELSAAPASAPDERIARVTHDGFGVTGPRFDRFVCGGCPATLLYAAVDPHGFPSMNRVSLGGSPPQRVVRRFLGSTTAPGRQAVYFDQLELRRNVGLYGDLYALDRTTNDVRALTHEARLTEPDLAPDEHAIVAVQDRIGERALVLVRLKPDSAVSTIDTLLFERETQFDAPRWSPDGRSIAVERHRLGGLSQVVVIDVEDRRVRVVGAVPNARVTTPAWTADGRSIVAAVAPTDQPFNLYEFDAVTRASRQLTHTTGGATWPDVSPDGKTLAFVGYTIDGSDIFTMPYPAATNPRATLPLPVEPAAQTLSPPVAPLPTSDYSPLSTLAPTSWTPLITSGDQWRLGAAVNAFDVLGYHFYAASATWLVSAPEGAALPDRALPDWALTYGYTRRRATFFVSASTDTSFFAGPATPAGTPSTATLRERQFETGFVLPIRHTRVAHTASASWLRAWDEFTLVDDIRNRDRSAIRLSWATATALTYDYSISPERGVAIGATADLTRIALGSTGDATTLTLDARAYVPGFLPHHVVAMRAAAGSSTGDPASGRTFLLGGPGPDASVVSFDSAALSLLRGFGADSFAGSHAAIVNVDYRFPIARPQRGSGTWPFFLHTLSAAGFVDAGDAWTTAFDPGAIKTSVGAEIATDIVLGYYFPLTVTGGAAWGHDGAGSSRGGATFYARIGHAF